FIGGQPHPIGDLPELRGLYPRHCHLFRIVFGTFGGVRADLPALHPLSDTLGADRDPSLWPHRILVPARWCSLDDTALPRRLRRRHRGWAGAGAHAHLVEPLVELAGARRDPYLSGNAAAYAALSDLFRRRQLL